MKNNQCLNIHMLIPNSDTPSTSCSPHSFIIPSSLLYTPSPTLPPTLQSYTLNKLHCNLPSVQLVRFVSLYPSSQTVWRVGGYYHGTSSSLLRLRQRSLCLLSVAFSNLLSLSASVLSHGCIRTLGNDSLALLHVENIKKS